MVLSQREKILHNYIHWNIVFFEDMGEKISLEKSHMTSTHIRAASTFSKTICRWLWRQEDLLLLFTHRRNVNTSLMWRQLAHLNMELILVIGYSYLSCTKKVLQPCSYVCRGNLSTRYESVLIYGNWLRLSGFPPLFLWFLFCCLSY